MRIRWICAVLVAVLFVLAVPGRCSAQNSVTCASNDNGRQNCPEDTRGGATLVRVSYASQGPGRGGYAVTCESNNKKRRYCPINDPRSQVDLIQQLSGSPCTRGVTWGNDGLGIWVDRGCRARFNVTVYSGTPAWWWNSGGHHRPTDQPRNGACFFRQAHYSSDYFCQEKGTSLNVPPGFNDQISSIRIYGNVTVTFYNDANFGGPNASTRKSVSDLRSWSLGPYTNKNWNNRISSIRIY